MSHAKIVLFTPARTHPLESTPPNISAHYAFRAQHNHYPGRPDGMELTVTYPYKKFGVKIRPFGEEHEDFVIK